MHTGHYISGAAHGLLILWVLFGGVFSSDPPEVEVAEVSVISEAEFAALTRPATAPEITPDPQPLPQPDPEETVPQAPDRSERPEPRPEPVVPEPPAQDVAPEPVAPTPAPDLPAPEAPLPDPAPPQDAPDMALRPVPRPAPRVAPEPVPEPDPDAAADPDRRQAARPEPEPEATPEPEAEATAPEAAAPEIVTEAEEPARAPANSMRPRARPARPAQALEPSTETAAAEPSAPPAEPAPPSPSDETAQAIAGALAEALSSGPADTPKGPPLTAGERDGFRIAVQECWVVDVGSQSANVTVTVGFELDRQGRVMGSSLRMLDASGGTGPAVDTAFQAARRAILRCQGAEGYELPVDKYDQWRNVEMTFNPENMRIR